MNENGEKLYVFQFNEKDIQKLFVLLRDCVGIAHYDSLTSSFFAQMEKQRMSFSTNPEWTQDIVLPVFTEVARCPECGQTALNIDEITSPLRECTYYYPRHIPPTLIFTCGNPDCPRCDNDFHIPLTVIVITGIPEWRDNDES